MKRKRIFTILVLVLLTCALSTTAFAIDESEVESAIAASSQEEVAGNIFIWFLCAIGVFHLPASGTGNFGDSGSRESCRKYPVF